MLDRQHAPALHQQFNNLLLPRVKARRNAKPLSQQLFRRIYLPCNPRSHTIAKPPPKLLRSIISCQHCNREAWQRQPNGIYDCEIEQTKSGILLAASLTPWHAMTNTFGGPLESQ